MAQSRLSHSGEIACLVLSYPTKASEYKGIMSITGCKDMNYKARQVGDLSGQRRKMIV